MTSPRHYGARKPGKGRDIEKPAPRPQKAAPMRLDDIPEAKREQVRELDARGYLASAIAAVTHLPYAAVEAVLTQKPTPKKPQKSAGGPSA